MKPRVLQVLNRPNIGGIVPQVLNTAKYLQPHFETLVISGHLDEEEAGFEHLFNEYGIELRLIPNMYRPIHPLKDYKAYKATKEIIADFKPDIVHTHAAKAGGIGRLAAAHSKVPAIFHTFHGHVFHSYFGSAKTQFFIEIERYLARRSSGIIAISKLQKEEISETYKICPAEKTHIVPLGYQLDRFFTDLPEKREKFRAKWRLAPDTIVIGMIGRLVPIKNVGMFVEAIKQVKEQTDKKVKGVLIGDGEERAKLEGIARDLGLTCGTESGEECDLLLTSWITETDEAYAGLDIVCLTSFNEGTPVSLIEAQAAGLPIAATNVGGVRDTVLENDHVLLSPSGEIEAMTANLSKLIGKISSQNIDFAANREFVLNKFGVNSLIFNVKNLYEQFL